MSDSYMPEKLVDLIVVVAFVGFAVFLGIALYNALTRVDSNVMQTYRLTGDLTEGLLAGPLPSSRTYLFRFQLAKPPSEQKKEQFTGTIFAFSSGGAPSGTIPPFQKYEQERFVLKEAFDALAKDPNYKDIFPSTVVTDTCKGKPCICLSSKPIMPKDWNGNPSELLALVGEAYDSIKYCRAFDSARPVQLDFVWSYYPDAQRAIQGGEYLVIRLEANACATKPGQVCVTTKYDTQTETP